jgi:hypothetical protein
MEPQAMEYKKPFQIIVSGLNNDSLVITTRDSATVKQLKDEVARKINVSASNVTLMVGAVPLSQNEKTLREMNIQHGANVTMNLAVHGGCCECDCCCCECCC